VAYRTGHDIGSQYGSMFSELVIGNSWASLGGPGHWNDVSFPSLPDVDRFLTFILSCFSVVFAEFFADFLDAG